MKYLQKLHYVLLPYVLFLVSSALVTILWCLLWNTPALEKVLDKLPMIPGFIIILFPFILQLFWIGIFFRKRLSLLAIKDHLLIVCYLVPIITGPAFSAITWKNTKNALMKEVSVDAITEIKPGTSFRYYRVKRFELSKEAFGFDESVILDGKDSYRIYHQYVTPFLHDEDSKHQYWYSNEYRSSSFYSSQKKEKKKEFKHYSHAKFTKDLHSHGNIFKVTKASYNKESLKSYPREISNKPIIWLTPHQVSHNGFRDSLTLFLWSVAVFLFFLHMSPLDPDKIKQFIEKK